MSAFKTLVLPNVDEASEVAAMKRMWAAKLLVHVQDYSKGVAASGGKHKKAAPDQITSTNAVRAYLWFTSEDDSPATFRWICEIFDLDPERTRMRIFHGWRNLTDVGLPKAEKPKKANGKGRAKDKITEETDDE